MGLRIGDWGTGAMRASQPIADTPGLALDQDDAVHCITGLGQV